MMTGSARPAVVPRSTPGQGARTDVWAASLIPQSSGRVSSSVIRELLAVTARPDIVSMAGGLPDERAMPADWLAECAARALGEPGALQYSTTEGDPALRSSIADWESAWTGRPTDPDDVLVTSGSQQALDLLCRTLLDPGDAVVIEDPAYVGAIQALTAAGASLHVVPQDREGMSTELLADRLAAGLRPKLVYVTPTFHNPAGSTLPENRRRHLAALADRYGFLIVEDDAYRRLAFGEAPPAPVAGYTDRTARLGTFSKILSPGLRVGWLTAPRPVLAAVTRSKQAADLHTSTLAQALLREAAADEARLQAHVDQVRVMYRDRAAHLTRVLAAAFGDRLAAGLPRGGMFSWAVFTDGTDTDALLPQALANGVAFVPGRAFSVVGANGNALRLCFASVAEPTLTEGVRRLRSAWEGHASRG